MRLAAYHRDIARTAGLVPPRDVSTSEIRSLEAPCLGKHVYAYSAGTMIETAKRRCP